MGHASSGKQNGNDGRNDTRNRHELLDLNLNLGLLGRYWDIVCNNRLHTSQHTIPTYFHIDQTISMYLPFSYLLGGFAYWR